MSIGMTVCRLCVCLAACAHVYQLSAQVTPLKEPGIKVVAIENGRSAHFTTNSGVLHKYKGQRDFPYMKECETLFSRPTLL